MTDTTPARVLARRVAVKKWRKANREKFNAYQKIWYHANPEKNRSYRPSRRKYPPTRPRPEACEICGSACTSGRALALDHEHTTGQFRGWLCIKCNMGLGCFRDDPELLVKAKAYLNAFSGGPTWLS